MQLSATDALDLAQESPETRELYGLDNPATRSYGTRCLMARRLVERGVRFVQIFMAGQPWDTHSNNAAGTRSCCEQTDRPVAGLLTDLKRRGLLDETLVVWGGEFGRTPGAQGKDGRDHHPYGFSVWLAGGGIKGGQSYGATDDFGYRAAIDRTQRGRPARDDPAPARPRPPEADLPAQRPRRAPDRRLSGQAHQAAHLLTSFTVNRADIRPVRRISCLTCPCTIGQNRAAVDLHRLDGCRSAGDDAHPDAGGGERTRKSHESRARREAVGRPRARRRSSAPAPGATGTSRAGATR